MQMSLLTNAESAAILRHPLKIGLAQHLLGHGAKVKILHQLKTYGCRHCSQPREVLPTPKRDTLFTFIGLRSHLGSK